MDRLRSPKEVRKQNRKLLLFEMMTAIYFTAWALSPYLPQWLFPDPSLPDSSALAAFAAVTAVLVWVTVILTVTTNRKVQNDCDTHHQNK
ncbi:hypothetical protein C4571_02230 [Candidatus Parcubacteria bacterium]|nr:MAG: hypothetical protein C4571_02230 [Candidatus Parcubacteria bacterium]